MGGRGSSSGISHWYDKHGKLHENRYGTQYTTLLTKGNIKFVKKISRDSEDLFETMTQGRVYVVVGGEDLLRILYFDKHNQKSRTIDLKPPAHDGLLPHTHYGYVHDENGTKPLTAREKRMVDRIRRMWENRHGK